MCSPVCSFSASRNRISFAAGAALPRSVPAWALILFTSSAVLSGTTSTAGEIVTCSTGSVRRCVSGSK